MDTTGRKTICWVSCELEDGSVQRTEASQVRRPTVTCRPGSEHVSSAFMREPAPPRRAAAATTPSRRSQRRHVSTPVAAAVQQLALLPPTPTLEAGTMRGGPLLDVKELQVPGVRACELLRS